MDGSGVLYDPAGINRTELRRLATQRLPVKHFNRSLVKLLGLMHGSRGNIRQWKLLLYCIGYIRVCRDNGKWKLV